MRKVVKALSHEQVNQVLAWAANGKNPHSLRNYCMIYVMLVHGLRTKEMLSLCIEDADLINNWLRIRRCLNGFDDIHPLTDNERDLLDAWIKERTQQAENSSVTVDNALFITRKGRRWSRQGVTKFFFQLSQEVGFEVTSMVLCNTSRITVTNLPSNGRDVRMYFGRAESNLTLIKKRYLQRDFRYWQHGLSVVLKPKRSKANKSASRAKAAE